MSFIVIIVCLCIQWFLQAGSLSYQYQSTWMTHYVNLMRRVFSKLLQGHDIFGLLIFVLPIVIVASLIFTLTYHLFGSVGYFVLSLVVLWYCVDITELHKNTITDTSTLLLHCYEKLFAPLFWFFVFGPVGLIFYVTVEILHKQLGQQHYLTITQGVLDWVPLRLAGLSFALVSNFGAVFKEWMVLLPKGILDNASVMTSFGNAALASDKNALSLLHRAIIVWLVVMALITIGIWIG